VHFIVTGGALDATGQWHDAHEKFLVPVEALSNAFRASKVGRETFPAARERAKGKDHAGKGPISISLFNFGYDSVISGFNYHVWCAGEFLSSFRIRIDLHGSYLQNMDAGSLGRSFERAIQSEQWRGMPRRTVKEVRIICVHVGGSH